MPRWRPAASLPEKVRVPWIAWPEIGPTGKWQIFVSRLDTSTRNSFLQVGGSLNVDPNHDARHPVITFVGNVPYVVWLEDDGSGKFEVQVRHLASDPQTGSWALDTPRGRVQCQRGCLRFWGRRCSIGRYAVHDLDGRRPGVNCRAARGRRTAGGEHPAIITP